MARRKTEAVPAVDGLREELAEKYRDLAERYGHIACSTVPGAVVPPGSDYFSRLADELEGDEPVFVAWWQVPRWVPGRPRTGWARIDADGTVTPATRADLGGEW